MVKRLQKDQSLLENESEGESRKKRSLFRAIGKFSPFFLFAILLESFLLLQAHICFPAAFQQGLRASFFSENSSPSRLLLQRFDSRVNAGSEKLLLAPFFREWSSSGLQLTNESLRYRIIWEGEFQIPEYVFGRDLVGDENKRLPGLQSNIYPRPGFMGQPLSMEIGENGKLSLPVLAEREKRSLEMRGVIQIAEAGTYLFSLLGNEAASLSIDDRLRVEKFVSEETLPRRALYLQAGEHSIRIRVPELRGDSQPQLVWQRPGGDAEAVPLSVLSHYSMMTPTLEFESQLPFLFEIGQEVQHWAGPNSVVLDLRERRGELRFQIHSSFHLENFSRENSLRLRLGDSRGEYVDFPTAYLSPKEVDSKFQTQSPVYFWLLFLIVQLFIGFLFFAFARSRSTLFRFFASERYLCLAACVLFVAAILRVWDYNEIPYLGDTTDELANVWLGLNLLLYGQPSSWTWEGVNTLVYPYHYLGSEFLFAKNCFHPLPIMGLFSALCEILFGGGQLETVSPGVFRLPAIICSIVSTYFVLVLAKRCFDKRVAILSSLLYATLPVSVLLGRLNKEENLLTLIALWVCFLLIPTTEPQKKSTNVTLLVLGFFLVLIKETGIFAVLAAVLFCIVEKRWRALRALLTGAFSGGVILLLYGWYYDWQEFLHSFQTLALWSKTLIAVQSLFVHSQVDPRSDGWLLWLWGATIVVYFQKNVTDDNDQAKLKARNLVGLFILSYVAIQALCAPAAFDGSWYRIPLYPFLSIYAGAFLDELLRRPTPVMFGIFLFTGFVSTGEYLLFSEALQGIEPTVVRLFLAVAVGALAMVAVLSKSQPRATSKFVVAALLFFFIGNVEIVRRFWQLYAIHLGSLIS